MKLISVPSGMLIIEDEEQAKELQRWVDEDLFWEYFSEFIGLIDLNTRKPKVIPVQEESNQELSQMLKMLDNISTKLEEQPNTTQSEEYNQSIAQVMEIVNKIDNKLQQPNVLQQMQSIPSDKNTPTSIPLPVKRREKKEVNMENIMAKDGKLASMLTKAKQFKK